MGGVNLNSTESVNADPVLRRRGPNNGGAVVEVAMRFAWWGNFEGESGVPGCGA